MAGVHKNNTPWLVEENTNHGVNNPIKKIVEYKSAKEWLKSWDLNMKNETDEEKAKEYIIIKNQELYDYIHAKYPKLILDGFDINNSDMVFLGIILTAAEENNFTIIQDNDAAKMPSWLQCTFDVVWGYFNVIEAYNDIVAVFTGGASTSTVVQLIIKHLKKHATWIGAIIAIHEIYQDCF